VPEPIQPSPAARRIAAVRRDGPRLETAYGDPDADQRLAAAVAGPGPAPLDERTSRYLRGRTAFVDRVVVRALERGAAQVVLVEPGYDGRAHR
jgi:O-methyltransferase involved in polyketide biosynthesis